MPRRPPPSALLLHPGPTPPRSRPKHTLPSLPRPAFCPDFYPAKSSLHAPTLARTTSRDASASTMMGPPHAPTPTPILAPALAPAPVHASSYTAAALSGAWLWSWLPGSSETSPTSSSSSSASPTRSDRAKEGGTRPSVRGPWDHSRSLSESMLDVDRLIKVPKPAAVTVSPLSSAVW